MASNCGLTVWTKPGSLRRGRGTRSGRNRSAICWSATSPVTSWAATSSGPRGPPSWLERPPANPRRLGRSAPRRLRASRRHRNPDPGLSGPRFNLHNFFRFAEDSRGGTEPLGLQWTGKVTYGVAMHPADVLVEGTRCGAAMPLSAEPLATLGYRVNSASGSWSGRPDLNRRPRGPKPRALASLRYAPIRRMVACDRRWVKHSASLARRGWAGWR